MSEIRQDTTKSENLSIDQQVNRLINQMTTAEKIGQLGQFCGAEGHVPDYLANDIRAGNVGSVLNEVCVNTINHLQHLAVNESRLGIPLLIGRDVIHGFKTIFPIPLGQAATWSADCVELGARISAIEAASSGINWTFAPMIDISRDPRWGRIAESLGEDPYLCSTLGVAMVKGFQGDALTDCTSIAACAKHFAGYGAAESGRDYNTANIPENELRNVYLPPFKAAADAGVATFMASFSDLNGVPASGNEWLMDEILREEWHYSGVVVSDWDSIRQLSIHGFTENDKEAACAAANAGIDMEMVSKTYHDHLPALLDEKKVTVTQLDLMVSRILTLKFELGLFEQPFTSPDQFPELANTSHMEAAKNVAIKSCVLLKNDQQCLPLNKATLNSVAVIGPLADDGYEQLGTWIFDGEERHSQTCLQAITDIASNSSNSNHANTGHAHSNHFSVNYVRALETTRSNNKAGFAQAVEQAQQADVALLFLGEESILSGEAHSRSSIDLPGCQEALIAAIAATGTPIVLIVMAGRPLTIGKVLDHVDSVLYAWHPGSMGGPAIAELLFGEHCPSGKLPVTFPRVVGQIPLYYAQKHTGKPATDASFVHMNDIPARATQTSLGMAATHLDTHFSPLFPFGFGLSYSEFSYRDLQLSSNEMLLGESITVSVTLENRGDYDGEEVVQLYIRDLVGSVTRPVKELKKFTRVLLAAGTEQVISFTLNSHDLAFYNRKMRLAEEKGRFIVWVGGSSACQLSAEFTLI